MDYRLARIGGPLAQGGLCLGGDFGGVTLLGCAIGAKGLGRDGIGRRQGIARQLGITRLALCFVFIVVAKAHACAAVGNRGRTCGQGRKACCTNKETHLFMSCHQRF